jgi:HlyD family secretion protein
VIAQNLRDMRVEVSVDETDVGRIQPGQKASFTVDAFPGQTFEGRVDQVRKAAIAANNVVTYVAAVHFANRDGRLLPGMTANVRIVTDARENVLKLPNAALRMRIAGVEPSVDKAQNATESRAGSAVGTSAGGQKHVESSAPPTSRGRVYLRGDDGQVRAVNVRLGLTDGSHTELVLPADGAAPLAEGQHVITGTATPAAAPARTNAPRLAF